uniref:Uncharacterized protein n=1 Tax=Mucochytrium quahogii TaxID=96639 RepID=A0A7S2WSB4_9STRA
MDEQAKVEVDEPANQADEGVTQAAMSEECKKEQAESGETDTPGATFLRVKNVKRGLKRQKLLDDWGGAGVKIQRIKRNPNKYHADVYFETEDDLTAAEGILCTLKGGKGKNLAVKRLIERPRKEAGHQGGDVTVKNVNQVVAPLHEMPYNEQLDLKQRKMIDVLRRLAKEFKRTETKVGISLRDLPSWCYFDKEDTTSEPSAKRQKTEENAAQEEEVLVGQVCGAACPIERIISSPSFNGYRNKTQFTIGSDSEGKACVGHRLGKYGNSVLVAGCDEVPTLPKAAKELAKRVESYIREESKLGVYCPSTQAGFWSNLMVRYFESTGDMMALFTCFISGVDASVVDDELNKLTKYITGDMKYDGHPLKSVMAIKYEGLGYPGEDHPTETLFGDQYIYDELDGVRYAVSHSAFFQVNSKTASIMYRKATEWASEGGSELSGNVVLDVCCGTGTIGLSMAKKVKCVVGVDCCTGAIKDAVRNAESNHINNAHFVAAMAEDVIGNLLSQRHGVEQKFTPETEAIRDKLKALLAEDGAETLAIVDPPRAGLHRRVIRSLRVAEHIKRVVYISCNPTGSFVQNAVSLCRAEHKQRPGKAFKPVKAVPVDLFPHTEHTELIVLFERA